MIWPINFDVPRVLTCVQIQAEQGSVELTLDAHHFCVVSAMLPPPPPPRQPAPETHWPATCVSVASPPGTSSSSTFRRADTPSTSPRHREQEGWRRRRRRLVEEEGERQPDRGRGRGRDNPVPICFHVSFLQKWPHPNNYLFPRLIIVLSTMCCCEDDH